jgi:serine protease Do
MASTGSRLRPKLTTLMVAVVCLLMGILLAHAWRADDTAKAESSVLVPQGVAALEDAFVSVAQAAEPAVVTIQTESTQVVTAGNPFGSPFDGNQWPFGDDMFRRFFGEPSPSQPNQPSQPQQREYKTYGGGSGIIIRSDGYILTNDHVVGGADEVTVILKDGTKYKNGKVFRDFRADIAVVKIDAHDLPVAKLGDSDSVKPGQWAIAIGSPFGQPNTLTVGVISAVDRKQTMYETPMAQRLYSNMIQTDAEINPGNSGGPLMNIRGEVVGVNAMIQSTTGVFMGAGYAIPINKAKEVADELIKEGKIEHGWLGVSIRDVDPEYADHYGTKEGAYVGAVSPGGPADEAGIQADDIVVEIGGTKISDSDQLVDKIGAAKPGTKMNIVVLRDKSRKELTATVRAMPEEMETGQPTEPTQRASNSRGVLGATVQNITPEMAKQMGWSGAGQGVVVSEVASRSPASEAGIQQGDIIRKINAARVRNTDDFAAEAKKLKGGSKAYVVVERSGTTFLVEVDIPK